MSKKKIILIILPFILLIFYWGALLIIQYVPFFKERIKINVQINNNETVLINDSFDFSFKVSSKCHIDSDILNHLAGGYWSGKLICDNSDDYIDMKVLTYDKKSLDDFLGLNDFSRIYGGFIKSGYFHMKIINKDRTKVLDITGNDYSKNIWNDILNTIVEK